MKKFLYLFVSPLILFSACDTPSVNQEEKKPFQHAFDFKEEAKRLDKNVSSIIKTLVKEGKKETTEVTVNSWANTELLPFIEADINITKLKGQYNVDSISTPFANTNTYTYSAKNEKLKVKLAEYTYQNGKLTSALIVRNTKNDFSTIEQTLIYEPQYGYSIQNRQSVSLTFDESFYIQARFANAAQNWVGNLDLSTAQLPIRFLWSQKNKKPLMQIINASENIAVEDISTVGDSLKIQMPVFESYFMVKLSDSTMQGYFYDPSRSEQYKIPFQAHLLTPEEKYAPFLSSKAPAQLEGKWETTFGENEKAIGLFNQRAHTVYGTFVTETGDYRYLEGTVHQDRFTLSTFDGAHAFLFTGTVTNDKIENGTFYSGNHYQENWAAFKNPSFALTHPDSLTFLKDPNQKIDFTFPDLEGNAVSLSDPKYNDKVVMISIFGSWCPNCMDETRYYAELYNKYNSQGLEVIGLAFERHKDFEKASKAVRKVSKDLKASYDFLIAGSANKTAAAEALPMLNHVLSFPTTIFINKSGEVVKIHTGFYGPGTGDLYTEFQSSTESFVQQLLAE